MRIVILVFISAMFIYGILKVTYVIGSSTGTKTAVYDNKQKIKMERDSLNSQKRLAYFAKFGKRIGGALSTPDRYAWDFRLSRLHIKIALTGHEVTTDEFVGILRFVQTALFAIGVTICFMGSWAGIVFLVLGFYLLKGVGFFIDFMLKSSEIDMEKDFPDFYMFVYSRLLKGANANLGVAVKDYYKNLQQIYPRKSDHLAIKMFIQDFMMILSVNATEVDAVMLLKDRYKSAIITSFCNLASQSLRGVNNSEKLLSFQMDLLGQQKDNMERVARQRAEMASYMVYSIYIILAEFIFLSWMSKVDFNFTMIF